MTPVLLELSCLGQFQARVDNFPVRFATDHGRALLAYLAVEADRSHARAYLAFLLWPDHPEPQALNNLRQTLIRLRQSLDMGDELASPLQITPKAIEFNGALAMLDVRRFQELLAQCKAHSHRSLEQCADCLQRLEQAAELYKGEFLQGLSLRHSQPFNEWATYVREELHHQMISVLHTLAIHYEEAGDYSRARGFVARQLILEPWQEEAHRQMMRVLAKGGHRSAAILQYETSRRVLQEELGIAPSSETTLLYERIKADTFDHISDRAGEHPNPTYPSSPTIANGKPKRARLGDLPAANRLYGRDVELAQLERWLIHDHSQLVTVLGMGGIGKTAITTAAVEAAAHHYDLLLWRSLINAPTLDEVLRDWLGLMSADSLVEVPETLDAQLTLLLHHLRERRCLLVLDNLESIFHAAQAGQVRPDYADYLQLFQQVAESQHGSCLVLTSREQLQGVALLDETLPWVRTLRLEGLDAAAAQTLLMSRDLNMQEGQAAALVNRYSGNPLALKLVAETIQEVFDGNVERFLATDVVIFDDIRAVLDQQFSRLPALEQELLFWLAIEREPLSLETLCANFSPVRPTPDVVQAVRALQRRSLLHRANRNHSADLWLYPAGLWTDTRFAISNVIMEYVVNRLVQGACREIEQEQPDLLHTYSFVQAQAKEYVRQSQERLILKPIANQLEARFGRKSLSRKLLRLLAHLRAEPFPARSYAVGNLLNLLLLLEIDIGGLDLAGLTVWQADLRHANLANLNLSGADLTHSRFADAFGIVYTAVISPDGTLVAAGTNGGEIRLWNALNGQLVQIYPGHRGSTRSLAFRPDGRILASCGDDHRVRLWGVEGDIRDDNPRDNMDDNARNNVFQLARILEGHSARVMGVAFHPNGNMLASVSSDHTVRLWDVVSGATRALLTEHQQPVRAVAFSPDGRTLATADVGGMICLWDSQSAELRTTIVAHTMIVMSVAFDPTGRQLASGSHDRTVCIWDVTSGERLHALEAASDIVTSVSFSSDGTLLAVGSDDHTLRLWETATWTPVRQLQGHNDAVAALAFSPNGQTLVSAGADHQVCLWDLHTARIHRIFSGYSQRINSLAYHPSGNLLASGHYDRSVHLWDTTTRRVRQTLQGHTLSINGVAFSNDGTLLASASNDKSIQLWAIPTSGEAGAIRRRFHLRGHQRAVTDVNFLAESKTLLSSSEDQTVGMWDIENGQPCSFMVVDEAPIWYVKSNRAGNLAATINDHTIRLWHVPSAELYKELPGHTQSIWGIDFSPNGQWLASGSSDGSVALWDVQDPRQASIKTLLRGHSERVFVVAFSPDGRYLASGSADHNVCLWDAQTHQLLHTFAGHSHWIWALAFSPDSSTLASGGLDETIRLWDIQSGKNIAVLETPGPYAGMKISGATGISDAERAILKELGAVE